MNRLYRRCTGCRRTTTYCDCTPYQNINFDTQEAISGNQIEMAYFGTKNFGFTVTCSDGETIRGPQFQGVVTDGTYMYVSCCDKDDAYGCIIKYTLDGQLVKIGPRIADFGHGKPGYDFKSNIIYVAQRRLGQNWKATGIHAVDPDTLDSVNYNSTFGHQVVAFVQYEKNLYYVNSDSTKLYTFYDVDFTEGTFARDLVSDIPVPAMFYEQFDGTGLGVQAWLYDGRTITAIRNNPQFAMIYDTTTKKYTLSKIGDVSNYRNIGEIEGGFTYNNKSVLISANDIADPIADINGVSHADIYVLFWYWDQVQGSAGNLSFRENTHPNFSAASNFNELIFDDNTTNRSVIINMDKDNFYCDGSQEFPFHSINEAVDYYSHIGNYASVQFQSDFDGFVRMFHKRVVFTQSGAFTVSIRFCDCQNCDIWLDKVAYHDGEFYKCNLYLVNSAVREATARYDHYYNSGASVSKVFNAGVDYVQVNMYRNTVIWLDGTMVSTWQSAANNPTAPGDIFINSGVQSMAESRNHT